MTLSETRMYMVLKKRKSRNARMYTGVLENIADDVDYLLQYIRVDYPNYPDHGIQHSFRILECVSQILGEKTKELTDTELFCFIMAALFHDSGMALTGYNIEELRSKHHMFSEIVINRYFKEKMSILSNSDRIKKAVIFACQSHGLTINELYANPNFEKEDLIGTDKIRYHWLSVFLRIGDLLDLDENRTNKFFISMFPHLYSSESLDHNVRHMKVSHYNCSPNKLEIEVVAQNIEQYKIWSTWFRYLKDEIFKVNTHFVRGDFCFPEPNTKIYKDDDANYDVEEIRFEIDENGGIWNIISQSIYTNELDFLREIIQNSIDASLIKIYLDKNRPLKNKSPRAWDKLHSDKNVFVCFSEKNNCLHLTDYGIGMNKDDLRNFLFKVSGSGYKNYKGFRDFAFPSIANYGIGFVSCLINAKKIDIYTCKENEKIMHQVSLSTNSNEALLTDLPFDNYIGTTIVLELRNQFNYREIREYVEKTFRCPSVNISMVDLDELETQTKIISPEVDFNKVLTIPYSIPEFSVNIENLRQLILYPLQKDLTIDKEVQKKVEELIEWIPIIREYEDDYSDRDKLLDFKNKIIDIKKGIENSNLKKKFPLSINEITEKVLLTDSENNYLELLSNFNNLIKIKIKNIEDQIKPYKPFLSNVIQVDFFNNMDFKYLIALLNKDLQICEVIITNEPMDLSGKMGIIILNQSLFDYDAGIECSALNGFLFKDGEVCTTIAQFTGYKRTSPISKSEEEKIILCSDSGLSGINDVLEYGEFLDLDNYAYYNSDYMYDVAIEFKDTYTALYFENNQLCYATDMELSKIRVHDVCESSVIKNIYPYCSTVLINDMDILNIDDFEKVIVSLKTKYCQDGIEFSFDLSGLFPIGYFKIILNTTADARMLLNVTRHELSQLRSDLDSWIENIGRKIQESLIAEVDNMFINFSLCVDYSKLLSEQKSASYFELKCKENIKKILKK